LFIKERRGAEEESRWDHERIEIVETVIVKEVSQ